MAEATLERKRRWPQQWRRPHASGANLSTILTRTPAHDGARAKNRRRCRKRVSVRDNAPCRPLCKNDAVRDAQDVGTTLTVGRWTTRASRLGGYDKTPWARECLGVSKSLFSSLQPTQPRMLFVSYSIIAHMYAILGLFALLYSLSVTFPHNVSTLFYLRAARLEIGLTGAPPSRYRAEPRWLTVECPKRRSPNRAS